MRWIAAAGARVSRHVGAERQSIASGAQNVFASPIRSLSGSAATLRASFTSPPDSTSQRESAGPR